MKRIMLFMMLMLGTVSAVMAQGADVPATDYDAMIGSFAGFVGGVVVLTEGLKGLFPNMKGWVTQLVSWCVGLVCAMLLWWLDAGFVSDVSWDIALLYGFGASLVANGVADTGLVQWVIGLTTLNNIVIHLSLFSGTLCICSSCMYCTVRETFDRVTEPAISGGTLYTDFFSLYFPVGI